MARGHCVQHLVFVVTIAVAAGTGFVAELCRSNERLLSCGGCQKTCEDPAPDCAGVCRVGCYCNDDEVRNKTGHCVKLADCPPLTAPYKQPTSEPRSTEVCPKNEEYRFCETCHRTCDNPNPMCPAQCARGCFCIGDLVRHKNGTCLKVEDCSKGSNVTSDTATSNYIKAIAYQLTCSPHQVFKECEPCEKTCSNPTATDCQMPCKRGCFCEEGLVRAPNGECIKVENCPKAVTMVYHELTVEDCDLDEVYFYCGWCEPTCSDPKPECPNNTCVSGCLCRSPLLRHKSGHCVEEENCSPKKCLQSNEEYTCLHGCEARCDSQRCSPSHRGRCYLGCHCRPGLMRNSNGNCITPDACVVKSDVVNLGNVTKIENQTTSETLNTTLSD